MTLQLPLKALFRHSRGVQWVNLVYQLNRRFLLQLLQLIVCKYDMMFQYQMISTFSKYKIAPKYNQEL